MAVTDTAGTKSATNLTHKLNMHLDQAQERLEDAKQQIEELAEENQETLRAVAQDVRDRIDQHRIRAEEVRRDVADWIEDKRQQTQEAITTWRQKRELKHLERRADRAEEYAVNALTIAMLDADEAELAVIDAIEARLDAEEAATAACADQA